MGSLKGWKNERSLADVFKACTEQGFSVERSNHHIRIIPPDQSARIVTAAATPGDFNDRTLVIADLRRSGLVWPWPAPPEPPAEAAPLPDLRWVPISHCSAYELSNGGMCREKLTGKIITPNESGHLVLFDDKGKMRHFSARAMYKSAFGHHPIPKLNLSLVKEETPVTAAPELPVIDAEAPTTTIRREIVLIEGIAEGYEVDENAIVHSPPHPRRPRWSTLIPQVAKSKPPKVSLRTVDGTRQVRFPLDEIVLEAFEPRPGPHWFPVHADDDLQNCRLSNLSWAEGPLPEEPAVPATTEETEAAAALADLAECKGVAAAEQHHSDYPEGHSIKTPGERFMGDAFAGYPEDHVRQDEELVEEVMGYPGPVEDLGTEILQPKSFVTLNPADLGVIAAHEGLPVAKAYAASDFDTIDVVATYTHRGTGLSVSVDEAGVFVTPEITRGNLDVVTRLLARARQA